MDYSVMLSIAVLMIANSNVFVSAADPTTTTNSSKTAIEGCDVFTKDFKMGKKMHLECETSTLIFIR